jgi:hypothetical protein
VTADKRTSASHGALYAGSDSWSADVETQHGAGEHRDHGHDKDGCHLPPWIQRFTGTVQMWQM